MQSKLFDDSDTMDQFSYQIGRLNGILEAFACVNTKTNNGYSFHIVLLPNKETLEESIEEFLKQRYPDASITFSDIDDWKTELRSNFQKWLFCYQPHYDDNGNIIKGGSGSQYAYLHDVYNAFSMSQQFFKDDFIDDIINSLASVITVRRGLSVFLNTRSYYEGDWNDFVLELEGGNESLFIHFGVYD